MTNQDAIALPEDALVQFVTGRTYRVIDVRAQRVCLGIDNRYFDGNPLKMARVLVVGRRGGRDFGPVRVLDASKLTLVS